MNISGLNASFQGIHQNLQKMNQAAQAVANPDSGADVSTVLDLKAAEHAIAVNAATAKVVYDTSDYLLDILV